MFDGTFKLVNLFEVDEDLKIMRQPFSEKFYEVYNSGFKDYIDGNWEDARAKLEKVEEIRGSIDGPSLSLLGVMRGHNFKAPADWEGWRDLED